MFHYQTAEELRQAAQEEGVTLPLSDDLSLLGQALEVQGVKIPNRVAIQPMEGCDGTADGKPGELTLRRYDKFAHSGAGLLWAEATAVWEEARANPRQLWIRKENVAAFQAINQRIRQLSQKENGFAPVIIMQATHSGRYSKPQGTPDPLIAYNNPLFEKDIPIPRERIVSDEYLHRLVERMGEAARLAQQAGFDGIDLKSCHRYLGSELLSAYNRPGDFGGSFENRTRFLRESVQAAKAAVTGGFLVTSRLNVYDGFPYPYGFGVSTKGGLEPDLTEPLKLVGILHQKLDLGLLDVTIGNPYVNPHVNRPYDRGPYEPQEHPLEGVARMFSCIGRVSAPYPDLTVVSSGHSYLRHLSPLAAAGVVESKIASVAGFGREALAYPDFANDILHTGGLDAKKCCVSCGKCSQLMRMNQVAGCAVRDAFYLDLFRKASAKKEEAK